MKNKSNNPSNQILSSVGFFLGGIGLLISLGSLLNFISGSIITIILPIMLGVIGFIFVLKAYGELKDDVVKTGLIINPLSIISGGLQIFL